MMRADLERRLRVLGWRPTQAFKGHVEWRHYAQRRTRNRRRCRYSLLVVEHDVLCDTLANQLLALACGRRPETR